MRQLTGRPRQSASEGDYVRQSEGEAPAVGNGKAQNAQPAQASSSDQNKQGAGIRLGDRARGLRRLGVDARGTEPAPTVHKRNWRSVNVS
jgi:hypothetical protein